MSNAKGEIGFYCERVCLMCQNGLEDATDILKKCDIVVEVWKGLLFFCYGAKARGTGL